MQGAELYIISHCKPFYLLASWTRPLPIMASAYGAGNAFDGPWVESYFGGATDSRKWCLSAVPH